MVKSLRIGTALTALGMIGTLTACASPGFFNARSAAAPKSKSGAEVGVASRAHMAVQAGNFAEAVPLAERAVEGNPQDAGFRALLGNAYFGAGRFASAEQAYRDSISLNGDQPQLVLKLALVQIAQGKRDQALALLEATRNVIDPSDYGLAMALAGRSDAAVVVLEEAARAVGADARARQNLALAYALQGDWTAAQTIAAQDLPADQVDIRVQQWMVFAKPTKSSDQVAALTGITPAAADPGVPVRLALTLPDNRMAAAQPVAPVVSDPVPVMVEEVAVAAAPSPPVIEAAAPEPAPAPIYAAAEQSYEPAPAPVVRKKASTKVAAKPALSPRAASFSEGRPQVRKASFPRTARGKSKAVVQLGAYASRSFVQVAWANVSKKYPALRGYTPATARFESPKGTVFRLSVQGFASDNHAREFCGALKQAGGSCFVRNVAGDSPVRMAAL